jgi:hypothetical protein
VLGKIGRREYMVDLFHHGTVFMPRLRHYRKEENPAVGDKDEGYFASYSPANPTLRVTVRVGGDELPLPGASLRIEGEAAEHGVYCLCLLEIRTEDSEAGLGAIVRRAIVDPRMREFGDSMVLMKNTPEFVQRLRDSARTSGYELDCDPVEYMPPTHAGELGPFRKADRYRYQKEWRFLTTTPLATEHLLLSVGPLTDIALLIDLNEPRFISGG